MTFTQCLIVIAVSVIGAVFCTLQVRRALREPSERDAVIAEAHHRTEHLGTAPEPDTEPGIDLALQDECELIWSMPAHDRATAQITEGLTNLFKALGPPPTAEGSGWDRLRDAIRDEQQKGETP